jgi:two-component system, OmpR family, KDP operon response regulator KdpE
MRPEITKPDVLVIDDENQIRRLLRFTLEDAGYAVREAETGHSGLVEMTRRQPDAVILDLGLPDLPGVQVLQRLREWTDVPVLILSVFSHESSKIAGLDAGADDYLTKPFGGGELLARLRALLRRVKTVPPETIVRFGAIEVDLVRRRVLRHGELVKLTAREYDLLRLLAVNADKVLTHRQLLTEIWGAEAESEIHYLRVFMMRLRQKLEDDPDLPHHLQTESGIGYRLVVEPTA